MGVSNRWQRRLLGSLLVAGTLLLAACASNGASSATGASSGTRTHDTRAALVPTTAVAVSDATALCAIFDELAVNGAGRDAQFSATTPEGWDQRIATTAAMIDAAPPEWKDAAATYHQMMEDRAQLAAENGYVGVNDLPAEVRNSFISSHAAMQAEVNEFIASMGRECGGRATG